VFHHYGLAGSALCELDLNDDRVVRATPSRASDFDNCADPRAYPRRHWLCEIARAVVP
jgi:hypothetical protein